MGMAKGGRVAVQRIMEESGRLSLGGPARTFTVASVLLF